MNTVKLVNKLRMVKHPVRFFNALYRYVYRIIDKRNWLYFGKHSWVMSPTCRISGKQHISVGVCTFIGKNARIEAVTQYAGVAYAPRIIIGDNVCINQNFHCTCAQLVSIGNGTSITANCGIFDIIHPYEDVLVNPREAEIRVLPIKIGKDCLIGMNSVILPGTELGDHCVVGANSVVSGSFPNYSVLVGVPAKIIKRYDFATQTWRKTDSKGNFIIEQ